MLTIKCLDDWFAFRIEPVELSTEAKAYIVGVLSKKTEVIEKSLVPEYACARSTSDFVRLQKIGDSVLFVSIIHPEFIRQELDLTYTIAKLSYYGCHRILDRKWPVYEELADRLPTIVDDVRSSLFSPYVL